MYNRILTMRTVNFILATEKWDKDQYNSLMEEVGVGDGDALSGWEWGRNAGLINTRYIVRRVVVGAGEQKRETFRTIGLDFSGKLFPLLLLFHLPFMTPNPTHRLPPYVPLTRIQILQFSNHYSTQIIQIYVVRYWIPVIFSTITFNTFVRLYKKILKSDCKIL